MTVLIYVKRASRSETLTKSRCSKMQTLRKHGSRKRSEGVILEYEALE